MPDTLPLLRGFVANDPLLRRRERVLSAAMFCHAAAALAQRLPSARFAFNVCERPFEFLLATAAALLAGQTVVLPPARIAAVIASLRRSYAPSYCLVDADAKRGAIEYGDAVAVSATAGDDAHWPPPAIAASHDAAILFTSGSTSTPQPHAKSWRSLVDGADTFMKSLGAPAPGAAILGTVAPQHMFGFETTVMLPLQSGTAVIDARPQYPADLGDVLRAARAADIEEVWLMTTPLQLRAFHRELASARGIHRVVASTMPLPPELALAVERDWGVPVHEIYGCTEGGMLATRRSATEHVFTPAAGLTFRADPATGAWAEGAHLDAPLALSDRIRLHDNRFELLGRNEDIVKIAGKRASLAGLTQELLGIPGVVDGVVFLAQPEAARVAALVVAPDLAESDVRSQLAERIDAAFLPRPLAIVDALPRDANGKLAQAALRDALASQRSRQTATRTPMKLTCRSTVAPSHPALPGHFPGEPIVPGVVLLQMIESMLAQSGYAVRQCAEVKFRAPIAPAQAIDFEVSIEDERVARFIAQVSGGTAMSGTFICSRTIPS